MACACEDIQTNCIKLSPCDTGIDTGVTIPTSGVWDIFVSFPIGERYYSLSIFAGSNIILPNELLAPYVHIMRVYDQDGQLLNDTCYALKTTLVMTTGNGLSPSSNSCAKKFITVEEDGDSISDIFFSNHVIASIATSNQMYLANVDFEQIGNIIQWTNGNLFYQGQVILVSA